MSLLMQQHGTLQPPALLPTGWYTSAAYSGSSLR
jgi:hypothetical protein